MPKKKTPTVLHVSIPGKPMPVMVTMNRAARRAHPNNPTQRLWPLVKLPNGTYIREDAELRKMRKR